MGLAKLLGRSEAKAWSQPPFWSLEGMRDAWYTGPGLPEKERVENDYEGYIAGAYKANGIVFACILARQLVFSEARFQWRRFANGRPGELFGDPSLALLETPWPNGTTGDLLNRVEVEASLAGNFYCTTADDRGNLGRAATGPGRRIAKMRPDRVTIIVGSASDDPYALDAKPVGYLYEPPNLGAGRKQSEPVILMPDEVAHFAPIPDPAASFRGMSWLTPVLREIEADRATTTHKLRFFEKGATLATVVKFEKDTSPQVFDAFVSRYRAQHEGADNAYKTLFLGGGADVHTVGTDLKQLDFKATQGAGETRIAMAARVPATILQASEGLAGSSLNAGNFGQARRMFADGFLRPQWRMFAASIQSIIPGPAGASLWYDDRDIPYLREDVKDQAEIQSEKAKTIEALIRGGFTPKTAVAAVAPEWKNVLTHTGLFSVQLQEAGAAAPPSTNGNEPAVEPATR